MQRKNASTLDEVSPWCETSEFKFFNARYQNRLLLLWETPWQGPSSLKFGTHSVEVVLITPTPPAEFENGFQWNTQSVKLSVCRIGTPNLWSGWSCYFFPSNVVHSFTSTSVPTRIEFRTYGNPAVHNWSTDARTVSHLGGRGVPGDEAAPVPQSCQFLHIL